MLRLGVLGLLVFGLVAFGIGAVWTARGYWPFRFAEPFDLMVFGGAGIWFAVVILFRARRHHRGVLIGDMPELLHFSSEAQRQVAVDQVVKELRQEREIRPAMTVLVAVLSAVVAVPLYLGIRFVGSMYLPVTAAKLLGVGAVFVLMLLPAYLAIRRGAPKLLRRKLLSAGVPVCMACGYVLRGCPGPNCPECGTPFADEVRTLLASQQPDE